MFTFPKHHTFLVSECHHAIHPNLNEFNLFWLVHHFECHCTEFLRIELDINFHGLISYFKIERIPETILVAHITGRVLSGRQKEGAIYTVLLFYFLPVLEHGHPPIKQFLLVYSKVHSTVSTEIHRLGHVVLFEFHTEINRSFVAIEVTDMNRTAVIPLRHHHVTCVFHRGGTFVQSHGEVFIHTIYPHRRQGHVPFIIAFYP